MRFLFILGFLFSSVAANAAQVELDFEEVAYSQYSVLNTQGYNFSGSSDVAVSEAGFYGYESQYLIYWPGEPATMTLDRADGEAFSLESLDMFLPSIISPSPWTITGYYSGGGSVSVDLYVSETSANYQFDDSWDNLDHVIFGAEVYFVGGMDNIVVTSAVPIPTAAWLFGSALAGLGWIRRKQTN
jgi:hypothetical protein